MQNMKCNLISETEGNALQNYVSKKYEKPKKENMLKICLDEIVFVWDICVLLKGNKSESGAETNVLL